MTNFHVSEACANPSARDGLRPHPAAWPWKFRSDRSRRRRSPRCLDESPQIYARQPGSHRLAAPRHCAIAGDQAQQLAEQIQTRRHPARPERKPVDIPAAALPTLARSVSVNSAAAATAVTSTWPSEKPIPVSFGSVELCTVL